VLVFPHYDRILEVNKEKRFILAHYFRDFSPWLFGSIIFRPVTRQKNIMVKGHCGANMVTSWYPGSRDTRRE
jgi:hypothetical protein